MTMISVTNLSTLERLFECRRFTRPSLLLIRSDSCPPCVELHPQIEALAKERSRQFDFYEFNVDHCAAPELDARLTLLFQRWSVKYLPSQVFLATGLPPTVISTRRLDVIERRLHLLARPGVAIGQKS
jgi:thiol-disulfide isomerase/thioredoxin